MQRTVVRSTVVLLALGLVLSAIAPTSAQAFTFTVFDYPGSIGTFAFGVNDLGQVAGYYVDPAGMPHAYVRDPGPPAMFTVYDFPQATGTYGLGVNNAGQIIGACSGGPSASLTNSQAGCVNQLARTVNGFSSTEEPPLALRRAKRPREGSMHVDTLSDCGRQPMER